MDNRKSSFLLDISLLASIILIIIITIFVAQGPNSFLFNLVCLMITFILIIITYFTNIITGLIFNLLFFFGQLVYVFYVSIYLHKFNLGYAFWLVIPPLLCMLIYGITSKIRELERDNSQLTKNNTRLITLDQDTQMRTLNMFEEDFAVLSRISSDHSIQLNIMVVRIRHWDSLKSLLTEDQTKELIQTISKEINEVFNHQNFKYIIDRIVPTWGIMSMMNSNEMKIVKAKIKEGFAEKLKTTNYITDVNVDLVISISTYDSTEMNSSTDFLADGVRELQYDV